MQSKYIIKKKTKKTVNKKLNQTHLHFFAKLFMLNFESTCSFKKNKKVCKKLKYDIEK
jgi:hypothetical protein